MTDVFKDLEFKNYVYRNVYNHIKIKTIDFIDFYNRYLIFLIMICYYYKVNVFKKRELYIDHKDFSENVDNMSSVVLPVTMENIYHECIMIYYFEKERSYVEIPLNEYKESFCISFESNRSLNIYLDIIKDETFEIFDLLNSYDLSCSYKINLFEYIYGTSFVLNVFGNKICFAYNGGKISTIIQQNMGLPFIENGNFKRRGDLYLFLELELPNNTEHFKPELDKTFLSFYKQLMKLYLQKLLC